MYFAAVARICWILEDTDRLQGAQEEVATTIHSMCCTSHNVFYFITNFFVKLDFPSIPFARIQYLLMIHIFTITITSFGKSELISQHIVITVVLHVQTG